MKILWFTWKDKKNPLAGGAEMVNENLAKRLAKEDNEIVFLVAGFKGALQEETINGYKVIRLGNKWTVYWRAFLYYKKHLHGWADLVIDEVNTIPFFAKFYVKEKNILFFHQLCREIWFYEMFFPLNIIGYILEPFYTWLLRDRVAITVSESTKRDLMRFGFRDENVNIIRERIEIEPVGSPETVKKYDVFTILSLGSLRPMKRTTDVVKAFELAKKKIPDLQLIIAGDNSGNYGRKVISAVKSSPVRDSIKVLGRVSVGKKIELLQKTYILVSTSVKEGWGLTVTEANSQGTPAIVYDIDGLRDSVKNGKTGIVCNKNTPESLAKNIISLLLDKGKYENLRQNAWRLSKDFNFGNDLNVFHIKNEK